MPLRLCSIVLLILMQAAFVGRLGMAREEGTHAAQTNPKTDAVSEAELDRWIVDLDAGEFAVRARASQKLRRVGGVAIQRLAEAGDGQSAEASSRAIAILETMIGSAEPEVQLAALEHLAALKNRPAVARRANERLSTYREKVAVERLTRLGGREELYTMMPIPRGAGPLKFVIGGDWKGTEDDLEQLKFLRSVQTLGFYSTTIPTNQIAKLSQMPSLSSIELFGTKISDKDLGRLRKAMPQIKFDVRRGAMLGVRASVGGGPAVIGSVELNSAAEKAGLLPEDVIVKIDDKRVADFTALTAEIGKYASGDQVVLEIRRREEKKMITLKKKIVFGKWR